MLDCDKIHLCDRVPASVTHPGSFKDFSVIQYLLSPPLLDVPAAGWWCETIKKKRDSEWWWEVRAELSRALTALSLSGLGGWGGLVLVSVMLCNWASNVGDRLKQSKKRGVGAMTVAQLVASAMIVPSHGSACPLQLPLLARKQHSLHLWHSCAQILSILLNGSLETTSLSNDSF